MADPLLAAAPYYHGLLPREDLKGFLREEGDFLVRMSEPAHPGKREFVLSVMYDKSKEQVKHFIINKNSAGKYSVEKLQFDSVTLLVEHHSNTKTSITSQQPKEVLLKNPVGHRGWELYHPDIESTKKLGEGAFGEVHMGQLRIRKTGKKVPVAIKLAKLDNMTKEQIKEIMSEARLMRFFDHPNVVRLYGVAALQEPLMLVMELASNGALDSYLQKNAVSMEIKGEMCLQSSWGIEYLHEKNCLHRDIASRNCLYGDGKVKLADFGLSRTGTVYQMDPKNKVPIRWLAPETIRTAMYSQKTDVFSFGILVWEIFHNGVEPYPNMTVATVAREVLQGYRMPLNDIPGLNPEIISLVEARTWNDNPNDRYTQSDISKALERILRIPRPDFTAKKAPQTSTITRKSGKSD